MTDLRFIWFTYGMVAALAIFIVILIIMWLYIDWKEKRAFNRSYLG